MYNAPFLQSVVYYYLVYLLYLSHLSLMSSISESQFQFFDIDMTSDMAQATWCPVPSKSRHLEIYPRYHPSTSSTYNSISSMLSSSFSFFFSPSTSTCAVGSFGAYFNK